MKKWGSLFLSLALLSSAALPASVFAAPAAPAASTASTAPAPQEQAEASPEQIEARDYMDRMDAIVQYEDKAADAFNAVGYVSAANRKDVYTAMNNVIIPNYSKFYYQLKQIKPAGKTLSDLHAYYLQGASLQLQGMQLMKKSLYGAKINWTTYKQGQAKLKSGKAKLDVFTTRFQTYVNNLK